MAPCAAPVCSRSLAPRLRTYSGCHVFPCDDLSCYTSLLIQPSVWFYGILSYHFIQHFQFGFLPHVLASSHSPTLCIACLSISAGYNPSCLCSVDRSLLSANHLSYLTSEILPASAISQSMRCPSLQSNTFRVTLTALTPSSSSFICPPVCLQRISGQYSWCSLTYLFSAWNRRGQIIASCGRGDYAHAVYC